MAPRKQSGQEVEKPHYILWNVEDDIEEAYYISDVSAVSRVAGNLLEAKDEYDDVTLFKLVPVKLYRPLRGVEEVAL